MLKMCLCRYWYCLVENWEVCVVVILCADNACFIFIHLSILYIEYIHNRNNKHVYRTPTFYLFAVHSIIHNYTGNNYSLHFLPTTQSYFSLVPLLTPALIPDISPPYLFISVLGSRNWKMEIEINIQYNNQQDNSSVSMLYSKLWSYNTVCESYFVKLNAELKNKNYWKSCI